MTGMQTTQSATIFELIGQAGGGIVADQPRGIIVTWDGFSDEAQVWRGSGHGDPSDLYEARFELVREVNYGDDYENLQQLLDDIRYPYAVIETDRCNTAGGTLGAQETDGDHMGRFQALDDAAAFVRDMAINAGAANIAGFDDAIKAERGFDSPLQDGSRWTIIERGPATRTDGEAYASLGPVDLY